MSVLDEIEGHIEAGTVTHVHFGRSALGKIKGNKRFCTLHRPSDEDNYCGQGETCEDALTDAVSKIEKGAPLISQRRKEPKAKAEPVEIEVLEDLDDLLG